MVWGSALGGVRVCIGKELYHQDPLAAAGTSVRLVTQMFSKHVVLLQ